MITSEWIVLNRQPIRETDWLLEIFSERLGRLNVVVNERQLTWPIMVLDRCKSEISTIKNMDQSGASYKLHIIELLSCWQSKWADRPLNSGNGDNKSSDNSQFIRSACVLYIAELVQRFLPFAVPNQRLFKILCACIDALKSESAHDPWLRFFEYQLLVESGLGFDWQQDYQGTAITGNQQYYFTPGFGFSDSFALVQIDPSVRPLPQIFYGRDLLAISQQDFNTERLKIAKVILRSAIEQQLKSPLISRQLWLT